MHTSTRRKSVANYAKFVAQVSQKMRTPTCRKSVTTYVRFEFVVQVSQMTHAPTCRKVSQLASETCCRKHATITRVAKPVCRKRVAN